VVPPPAKIFPFLRFAVSIAVSGCRFWLPLLVAASGCRFAGLNLFLISYWPD
jgi:hypothetical protein